MDDTDECHNVLVCSVKTVTHHEYAEGCGRSGLIRAPILILVIPSVNIG